MILKRLNLRPGCHMTTLCITEKIVLDNWLAGVWEVVDTPVGLFHLFRWEMMVPWAMWWQKRRSEFNRLGDDWIRESKGEEKCQECLQVFVSCPWMNGGAIHWARGHCKLFKLGQGCGFLCRRGLGVGVWKGVRGGDPSPVFSPDNGQLIQTTRAFDLFYSDISN